ncbi:MAG TPA: hypothetical protein V6C65_34660, partial [Allocoleopsis sp.]
QQGAEALTFEANTPDEAGHYFGSDPDIKYGWGSHTNRPVPVYYQGNGSEILDGLVGEGYQAYGEEVPGIEGLVDQTHIYQTMYAAVTEGAAPLSPPPIPDADAVETPQERTPRFATASGDVLDVGIQPDDFQVDLEGQEISAEPAHLQEFFTFLELAN